MHLTLDKMSALRIIRALRSRHANFDRLPRIGLVDPSPAPATRWSAKLVDLTRFGPALAWGPKRRLEVMVSSPRRRLRMKGTHNTVCSYPLPQGSFLDVGGGLRVASPELLFVQMGALMEPAVLLMLGMELCGRFSRDALDPRDGPVAYHVPPASTASKIRDFVEACPPMDGLEQAAYVAPLLVDEAWSPAEAAIATMIVMPVHFFGYGMGPIVLNPRVELSGELAELTSSGSRVPDIVFGETTVGINYDGSPHFRLEELVFAAQGAALAPGDAGCQRALAAAFRASRAAIVGDKRRDRDLKLGGYDVVCMTSEDLYQQGALDLVMWQVAELARRKDGRDLAPGKPFAERTNVTRERQRTLWSLLPGERGERLARELANELPGIQLPAEVVLP